MSFYKEKKWSFRNNVYGLFFNKKKVLPHLETTFWECLPVKKEI
jgi:hypothetical protein